MMSCSSYYSYSGVTRVSKNHHRAVLYTVPDDPPLHGSGPGGHHSDDDANGDAEERGGGGEGLRPGNSVPHLSSLWLYPQSDHLWESDRLHLTPLETNMRESAIGRDVQIQVCRDLCRDQGPRLPHLLPGLVVNPALTAEGRGYCWFDCGGELFHPIVSLDKIIFDHKEDAGGTEDG